MKSKGFKILAVMFIAIILLNNIWLAINYYNVSSIHLSDNFYWQSINDVLIDNKVEKVQLYGNGLDLNLTWTKEIINGKIKIIYKTKRDSYRQNW